MEQAAGFPVPVRVEVYSPSDDKNRHVLAHATENSVIFDHSTGILQESGFYKSKEFNLNHEWNNPGLDNSFLENAVGSISGTKEFGFMFFVGERSEFFNGQVIPGEVAVINGAVSFLRTASGWREVSWA